MTPNTSLLVLETADQYVQYRVVPPKSQPEVYKQFLARIEQNKAQERADEGREDPAGAGDVGRPGEVVGAAVQIPELEFPKVSTRRRRRRALFFTWRLPQLRRAARSTATGRGEHVRRGRRVRPAGPRPRWSRASGDVLPLQRARPPLPPVRRPALCRLPAPLPVPPAGSAAGQVAAANARTPASPVAGSIGRDRFAAGRQATDPPCGWSQLTGRRKRRPGPAAAVDRLSRRRRPHDR